MISGAEAGARRARSNRGALELSPELRRRHCVSSADTFSSPVSLVELASPRCPHPTSTPMYPSPPPTPKPPPPPCSGASSSFLGASSGLPRPCHPPTGGGARRRGRSGERLRATPADGGRRSPTAPARREQRSFAREQQRYGCSPPRPGASSNHSPASSNGTGCSPLRPGASSNGTDALRSGPARAAIVRPQSAIVRPQSAIVHPRAATARTLSAPARREQQSFARNPQSFTREQQRRGCSPLRPGASSDRSARNPQSFAREQQRRGCSPLRPGAPSDRTIARSGGPGALAVGRACRSGGVGRSLRVPQQPPGHEDRRPEEEAQAEVAGHPAALLLGRGGRLRARRSPRKIWIRAKAPMRKSWGARVARNIPPSRRPPRIQARREKAWATRPPSRGAHRDQVEKVEEEAGVGEREPEARAGEEEDGGAGQAGGGAGERAGVGDVGLDRGGGRAAAERDHRADEGDEDRPPLP